ncbi:MAG: alpha/beta fold hydrolase [Gammaproteobacteria bacterium]|nr:alpha/beta fold hydrolase [Gammaproteobacteria bacterium]
MQPSVANPQAVILVHGLWMTGLEMALLQFRLKRAGFRLYRFHYRTVLHSPEQSVERLDAFVNRVAEPVCHIVAHSLGGLIVHHWLQNCVTEKVARVVTLGTPHLGSEAARRLSRLPLLGSLLGKSRALLCSGLSCWRGGVDAAVIAGTRPVGLGWWLLPAATLSDGVVTVAETRIQGVAHHAVVYTNHFGLLLNREVAEKTVLFLRRGRF